jgi:serine/threonine protein kinase
LTRLEALKLRKYIVPTLGYYITENGLNIFQPQMVSLFELLHCEDKSEVRRHMTVGDKYQLAFGLSKILNTLQTFSPPIVHGHLSAHNIFVELQSYSGPRRVSGIRIGDLELSPLQKYASTFYSYKNQSVWSAPELLKAGTKRQNVEPTPEADIYSFGMLMWELWHETVPFDNDVALCQ